MGPRASLKGCGKFAILFTLMNELWGVLFFRMSATSMYAINLFIFYTKINLFHVNFILDSVLQEAQVGLHNVLTIYG